MLTNEIKTTKKLSNSTLKIIAIISMLIDHTAAVLVSPYDFSMLYTVMRLIGRLAFPIFCFLLVEGIYHTSNRKKYLLRLGIFAIISEIPFDLAFHHRICDIRYQNVFFTLFLGALLIYMMEQFKDKTSFIITPKKGMCIFVICCVAFFLKTDYSYKGIILILCYYFLYQTSYIKLIAADIVIFLLYGFNMEIAAVFSGIPIAFYNEKRGLKFKYLFYIFYPIHLLVLFFIKITFFP